MTTELPPDSPTTDYLERYQSGSPEARRASNITLGKSGDMQAVSLLGQIIIGEPDPALQKLAVQAIQYLKPYISTTAAAPPPVMPSPAAPIFHRPRTVGR